jgi:hypothetical protein
MLAAAPSTTVAMPDAVSVSAAPMLSTMGPPITMPNGVETSMRALRAARTLGRLAVVVEDW